MKSIKDLQLFDGEIPLSDYGNSYNSTFLSKHEVNPFLAYIILKENFGSPNSEEFDEDKTQWQWLFSYKDFYIEIYDWRLLSTSIAIYHKHSNHTESEKLAGKITAFLNNIANQKKGLIKSKIKSSKFKILDNPFVTYYSTAENLISIARKIEELVIKESSIRTDVIQLWTKNEYLYRSAFLMFLSSFEGFINILYELYLKQELRTDRLYEKILREQIDIKIRIAPIYCDGFKVQIIDNNDARFKNYLKLVNLRNDYVHANLIKSLERYVVNEDNHTFIIGNFENSDIPTNISLLELKHIELAKQIIDSMVDLIFESMETKTRREFKRLIYETEIELENVDGILIPN